MEKNFNIQNDEKLAQEVQKYKCLYDKSDSSYKIRNRVANAWAAVEMVLNLSEGHDDFLCFYLNICYTFFINCVFS